MWRRARCTRTIGSRAADTAAPHRRRRRRSAAPRDTATGGPNRADPLPRHSPSASRGSYSPVSSSGREFFSSPLYSTSPGCCSIWARCRLMSCRLSSTGPPLGRFIGAHSCTPRSDLKWTPIIPLPMRLVDSLFTLLCYNSLIFGTWEAEILSYWD